MICPGCGNKNVQHAYCHTDNPPCASWPKCNRCGDATSGDTSDTSGSWKHIRTELGICNLCAIREETARAYAAGKKPELLIIGGGTYVADKRNTVPLGAADPNPRAQQRGMAGRRFNFQRLDGSEPVSCFSLWFGMEIDQWCRDRMPDNAVFLGAERVNVGGTTCFNGSEQ